MRILFVCDDNRRASVIASAFLYQERRRRPIEGLLVASAGCGVDASPVDPDVVQLFRDRGVDIGRKRPQQVTEELVDPADAIVTMTTAQAAAVRERHPAVGDRVFTLRHLAEVISTPPHAVTPGAWLRRTGASTSHPAPEDDDLDVVVDASDLSRSATFDLADRIFVPVDTIVQSLWPPPG